MASRLPYERHEWIVAEGGSMVQSVARTLSCFWLLLGCATVAVGQQNVTWTDAVHVTVTGNSLQKTGGCDGCLDAGAASTERIAAGDGYIEFTATETNKIRQIGLSSSNPGTTTAEIQFSIRLTEIGIAEVRESNVYRAEVGFVANDRFKIAVVGGSVVYSKNGSTFHTTTNASITYPLLADTALLGSNSTVTNVVMLGTSAPPTSGPVIWTSLANVQTIGTNSNGLQKSAGCEGCPDAGAYSEQVLTSGDGYVELTAPNTTSDVWIGFTPGSGAGTGHNAIQWAIHLNASGVAEVRENDQYRTDWYFVPGDTFRVSVTGGSVVYTHNNAGAYTSPVSATYPMTVDASILTVGGSFANAIFSGGSGGDSGQWSPVYTIQPEGVFVVPVHMSVLPNRKVLMWDWDVNQTTTQTWLWDPATGEPPSGQLTNLQRITNSYTELFCSGHAFMRDGRLLVAGGGDNSLQEIAHTSIFDWQRSEWSAGPDMPPVRTGEPPDYSGTKAGRWYPTVTALANGELLITGGEVGVEENQTPVVYKRDGSFRVPAMLAGAPWPKWYPFTFAAPNGQVFRAGGSHQFGSFATGYLDTASGGWTNVSGARDTQVYSSSVMYEPGKVLTTGGGTATGACENPTGTTSAAEVIDLTAGTPQWQSTESMHYPREYHNATVLPDGKVLVTGGTNSAGAVLPAEMWNPATGIWTVMASAAKRRGYHSTAVLLPDGRVMSGGTRPEANTNCYEPNVEFFSPPYLFQGQRPTIDSAPADSKVYYNKTFDIVVNNGGAIDDITWVRLSSVTHSFNENQRFNRLAFQRIGETNTLRITTPNPNQAPPGHYMLFVLDRPPAGADGGVPSVATIVRLVDPDPLGYVDIPSNNATVGPNFQIGGWAIDREATSGTGVDAIDVWAYRDGVTPVASFHTESFDPRADIAAAYGSQFLNSGFNLVGTLSPGSYLLVFYPHSTVNNDFTAPMFRWITVQ
jgi:hypothetical protein